MINDLLMFSRKESNTVNNRRPAHGIQSRADHHGRGRFNNVELEGRQNKPLIAHPPILVAPVHSETSNVHVQDHYVSIEASKVSGPQSHGKPDGQSMPPILDKSDTQEQVHILIYVLIFNI